MRGMYLRIPLFANYRTPAAAVLWCCLACVSLPAEQQLDLHALIGMDLQQVYQRLGVPAEVYTLRGERPEQDDVVFYYPSHLYLFWFQNRVWQARVDRRFSGTVFSVSMGATRRQVSDSMEHPVSQLADSLLIHMEDRGYPLQARLYFEEDRLVDVYCFRGDL